MMSPSLFLGFDAKKSEYHFFLHESNKIFICYKDTVLDEDAEEKWGYYEN